MEVDIVFFTNFAKVNKQRTVVKVIVRNCEYICKGWLTWEVEGDCLYLIVN